MFSVSRWRAASVVVAVASLLQACGGGGGGDSAAPAPSGSAVSRAPSCSALTPVQQTVVAPPASSVTVTGTATFDSVPNNPTTGALDYNAISSKPARGVTVQAISGSTIVANAITNELGAYSLALPANTTYFLRMRAEMINPTGPASWNVAVKDNTAGDALWVVDGAAASSGTASSVRSINAGAGWGGSSYTAARAAGPFAILDTVYTGMALVRTVQNASQFPPLTVLWSPNNNTAEGNLTVGEVGTSFFSTANCGGVARFIYILGQQNDDTDEFDSTIVAHEYGHYLQSAFSTNNSIGGSHGPSNKLDVTLAFSEGWGNGWSSMLRNNPLYLDSAGFRQGPGAAFSLATPPTDAQRGWYREDSIDTSLYALFKSQGFAPIWTALTGPMLSQDSVATIFSFAAAVRSAGNAAVNSALNGLLAAQNIFTGAAADQWGTGETNNGGNAGNLPVYNAIALNSPVSTCFITTNLVNSSVNKLGSVKYYRLALPSAGTRSFVASFPTGRDIDFQVYQKGVLLVDASSSDPTSELASVSLAAGEAVIRVSDFNVASVPLGTPCGTLTVN
jgi:hypothetical protein